MWKTYRGLHKQLPKATRRKCVSTLAGTSVSLLKRFIKETLETENDEISEEELKKMIEVVLTPLKRFRGNQMPNDAFNLNDLINMNLRYFGSHCVKKRVFFESMLDNAFKGKEIIRTDDDRQALRNMLVALDGKRSNAEKMMKVVKDEINKGFDNDLDSKDFPPEHPSDMENPPYGKYIFAPMRTSQVPFEENTDEEDEAYKALRQHILDNEPVKKGVADKISDVMKTDAYKNVLHEPEEELLYRGMAVNASTLRKFAKISDEIPERGEKEVTIEVTPKEKAYSSEGQSTSWSVDFYSAVDFTQTDDRHPYAIIIAARKSDNPDVFLDGTTGVYQVRGLNHYSNEKEAIALKTVKAFKIHWQYHESTGHFEIDEMRST